MTKDNLLFAVFGVLLGFVSGYLLQQVMSERQPPRRLAGDTAAAGAPAVPGPAAAPMPGGAGTAGMAEIEQLRQRVEANPNDAEAVLQLANMNFDIQNWDRARELYERFLTLRPNQPDILSDLGVTYRELRQYDKALELFNQAQSLAPDHWQSRFNEVIVLAFDLERYEDADRVLGELDRIQPGNSDVARLKAEVARQRSAAQSG